jgi:hypothetical protein
MRAAVFCFLGIFLKKMPPCTMRIKARKLWNRSKVGWHNAEFLNAAGRFDPFSDLRYAQTATRLRPASLASYIAASASISK